MKVLIADSFEESRNSLTRKLNELGYQDVIHAIDGKEAFVKIAEASDIGLIIIERQMPNIDGFAFLKKYRQDFPASNTPIAMIAAETDEDEKTRFIMGYDLDFYIQKPVSMSALVRMFAKLSS